MASEHLQIRLRQNMSRRIIAGKISKAREFLANGQIIEFVLPFRASETELVEQRMRIFGRVTLALQDIAVVDSQPESSPQRFMSFVMRPT